MLSLTYKMESKLSVNPMGECSEMNRSVSG